MKSKLALGYLWFCALSFLVIGILIFVMPQEILSKVDLIFDTPTALADIRADYGGCTIGIALFLAYCGWRRETALGLICIGTTMFGYASGRIYTIFVDGVPKQIIFTLLTVELVMGALAFVCANLSFAANRPNDPSINE